MCLIEILNFENSNNCSDQISKQDRFYCVHKYTAFILRMRHNKNITPAEFRTTPAVRNPAQPPQTAPSAYPATSQDCRPCPCCSATQTRKVFAKSTSVPNQSLWINRQSVLHVQNMPIHQSVKPCASCSRFLLLIKEKVSRPV